MRIGVWDLETTSLKGDVGRLLCGVIQDVHSKKYQVFRNDDIGETMADDGDLALQMRNALEEYDITVGWFSKGFDMAFLNTRLVKAGHKTIRPHLHLDGIWYMKGWRGLSPRSAKLKVAAEFFDLKERKPDVDVDVWINAAYGGDRAAMDELVERCKADVRLTWKVTDYLLRARIVKNIQMYP